MKGLWMTAVLSLAVIAGGCGTAGKSVKSSAPAPDGVDAQMQAFSGLGETAKTVQGFKVVILDDSLFKKGSSHLSSQGLQRVDSLASLLSKYAGDSVTLSAYTDNTGTESKNLKFSQRRADHIKAELVKQGLATAAVTAQGKGEANPRAANDTPEGQVQNRRVVFEIVPQS